ncbi:MAG TPA: protein kinase [Candidatus Sulfotelmatobacter sp.]|nr:protein kinase [Candidatus Sulfotelmatobacter sp.]
MNTPIPKRIGKYEVLELLGRGGMGMVYRAFDRQLNREVAIKTVTEGFSGDPEMLERFYREAAKTGALKHPNIVIVYDLGEQDGFPYIVMEYLSGEPLDRIIQTRRELPLASKLKIIEQICYALGYAHRNDVIHRDVKPANVIVQSDGVAKLLDFGIARQEKNDGHLTRTGHVIGTIHYMAPERLKNEAFDGRSDIFSVGVMLFQLLTGSLPFPGEYAIVQKILAEKQPPLSEFISGYPPALDPILDRALAKNPDDRYTTADDMAADLAVLVEELKKEQVGQWMVEAKHLVQAEDYTKARELLLRLMKLDSQHTAARQLMTQVQQTLALRQRIEQVRQLRDQADAAVSDKRFEEALNCLQEACRLDPANSELNELLETVRQKKRRRELVDGYLRQADSSREHGDLESAQSIIAKALEVDRDDSRVRAAHFALARLLDEEARHRRTKKLLEDARREISVRHFTAAIDLLAEVERVDPSNPELISLQATAKSGREQEQRRRILEQLQNEISLAATPEDSVRVAKLVDEALERMPGEPSLLKFRAHLARQMREEAIRRRVDGLALRCRELLETSPQEAQQLVRTALQEVPGNERLMALLTSVEAQISEQNRERTRAHYLTRAHDALTSGNYLEAAGLLEACQKEGDFSPEIAELLEFARTEAQQHEKDARVQLQTLERDINAALQTADKLRASEQYAEAITFLEAQPATIMQSELVQRALEILREAKRQELLVLQTIGRTYAALDRLDLSNSSLTEAGTPDLPLRQRVVPVFASRRQSIAVRQLSAAISQSQIAMEAGNKKHAEEILRSAATFSEYANSDLKNEWQALLNKNKKGKVLGFVRK